ncbi:E3 ubiquitin-protein ligase CIP8-like [Momordica charantia]|uniref:RING-type E3 ubiquitin transferase n=1 Tax=Momordica charantia TaxID=3673 RepID=A0A6J1CAF5_MOMCH|nr:E3 ubiquitin-protein ligase CIP8-like [Momordica charantia]
MSAAGLHCEVWQPQEWAESDCSSSSSEPPEFFIDLYVSSYANQGGETISSLRYKNFRRRRDVFTQDSLSWSAISTMLSETSVPYHLQPFFIQHISLRARRIAAQPTNALSRTIPIVVELVLPLPEEEESGSGSDPRVPNGPGRASRASIEEMERAEIELGICGGDCAICLDEIECGAVGMPCSHIYHRNCIVKWLQQNNLCPLCRFQMPLEMEEQEEQ